MDTLNALIEDFSNIEVVPPTTQQLESLEPIPISDTIDPSQWGELCFDLVLRQDMYEQVLKDYNLSPEGMLHLLNNKAFTNRLKDANIQVNSLGPTAGFSLAARHYAEKHITTLSNIASDIASPHAVRVKAIENLVRYAHLDPATAKTPKDSDQRSSPGVLVQFNIGGGLLGNNRRTLEVQTTDEIVVVE
jgi:hypothetical protein